VEISFVTRKLKQLCESDKELRRAFGTDGAKKTMRRLHDLRAATTLEDMRHLPGRTHELTGGREGQLAIDVAGGRRLILTPTDGWPAEKADGAHAWTAIDAVTVLEITDYH
jgi:proteic killer suppression protein